VLPELFLLRLARLKPMPLALLPTEVTLQICPVCPAPVVAQAHSFPAVLATAAGKMGWVDPLLDYFPAD
jgi:hypothetical protein